MNYTLSIVRDPDSENPRTWFDQVGTMVFWNRDYCLGDGPPPGDTPAEWLRNLAGSFVRTDDADLIPDEHVKRILDKHCVIMELWFHDGNCPYVTVSPFGMPEEEDAGRYSLGYIYCTAEQVQAEWGCYGDRAEAWAEKYLRGEVAEYSSYLEGDVWGFVICDEDGDEVDSCWGFYGHDYCEEEGESALEYLQRRDRAKYAASYAAHVGHLPSMQEVLA